MNETLYSSIKLVTFTVMILVGADCTINGLRDCLRKPWLTVSVGVGQFLIVPLVMYVCCYFTDIPGEITAGLMLIACCPTGAISNTYCFLIQGNTSLSVSLTTISNLAALVLTPIALIGIREIVGTQGDLLPLIPSDVIVKELGLMMVIPVLIGFGIRIEKPNWILGRQQFLRKLASVLMALLLLLVISTGPRAVARHFMEIFLVTFLFTAVLFGVGWLICSVFQLSTPDRWAVLFEFPCRNLAIAAVLGMTVLNRPELVRFSAALFIIQTTMLLTLFSASIYLKKSVSPPDL